MGIEELNDCLLGWHDAVLESVVMEWETAVVRVTVRRYDGRQELTVHALRSLQVPRELPWGHSVHVNRAACAQSGTLVEIEMQSGDTLRIEGASIEVLRKDDARPPSS